MNIESTSRPNLNTPFGTRTEAYYIWLAVIIVLAWPISFVFMYLSSIFIPAYSAETTIAKLDARVELKLYTVWDENDDGRYLTVKSPTGTTQLKKPAFDRAHDARTSLYLTPDSKIAVLGSAGKDYLLSNTFEHLSPSDAATSGGWTYVGAFDFAKVPNAGQSLQFITPDKQVECIPMLFEGPFRDSLARASARRSRCPDYWLPKLKSNRDPISPSR